MERSQPGPEPEPQVDRLEQLRQLREQLEVAHAELDAAVDNPNLPTSLKPLRDRVEDLQNKIAATEASLTPAEVHRLISDGREALEATSDRLAPDDGGTRPEIPLVTDEELDPAEDYGLSPDNPDR